MAKSLSVGIVLGCSNETVSFYERVDKAIKLYHSGAIQKILFTGGHADHQKKRPSEASLMASRAAEKGIAKKDILLENKSKNTKENAENSLSILKRINPSKVLVITNDYHWKSANRIFRQAGYLKAFPHIAFVKVAGDSGRKKVRRTTQALRVLTFRNSKKKRPTRRP